MTGTEREPVGLVPRIWTWSPVSVFEEMERMLNDMRMGFVLPGNEIYRREGARMPNVDLREEDERYLVQAELPGMTKEDVTIETDGDVLRMIASKEQEVEEKREGYIRRERGSMRFHRQMRLPGNVDRDKIKAKLENGVLEISLPKMTAEAERKNKIEVE
ncbi:MAG TPA: Hsp20/alpha crystallin family protein [Methanomassiliicoccales archaeon]|nr:Hsp20/alpha crystallin family protein [Methanomassiliicoccales archaeon]